MKKLFLLSLMAMLLPLATWAQEGAKTFDVTVKDVVYAGDDTKADITVKVGDATLQEGPDYYIIYTFNGAEVGSVRNAGQYTVDVKPASRTYDGYTAEQKTFTVEKKLVTALTLKVGQVEKTYGETDDVIKLEEVVDVDEAFLASGSDEKADFFNCLQLGRVSGYTDDFVGGNSRVTVTGNEDSESNYRYAQTGITSNIPLVIKPKELTLTIVQNRRYNGKPVTLSNLLSNEGDKYYKLEGILDSDKESGVAVKEFTAAEGVTLKDVADYTIYATLNNINYTLPNNGAVTYSITQGTLTITAKETGNDVNWNATYSIDGEYPTELTSQFTFTANPVNEVDDLTALVKMIRDASDNAVVTGEWSVYPYYNDSKVAEDAYATTLQNYIIKYDDVQKYTIAGKQIDADDITIEVDEDLLTYQGKDFEIPEGLITVTDGKTPLTENVDYTLAIKKADKEAKDAGDKFAVTVTGKDNYAGTKDTEEQTITRATLNITITEENAAKLTKVYGEADPELTDLYVIDKLLEEADEQPKLTMVRNGVGRNEDVTEDGYIVNVVLDGNKAISANNYKDGTVLKNYNIEYNRAAYKFYITPRTVKYWIAEASGTYTGKAQSYKNKANYTVETGVDKEGFINLESFTNIEGAVAPKISLAGTAINVNEEGYEMVVTNAEDVTAGANYEVEYVSDKDEPFYVKPAALTIKTLSKEINYGDPLPELSVNNAELISISGYKGNDTETVNSMIEFTLDEDALAGKVGVYDITFEFVEPTDKESDAHTIWNNYTISTKSSYGKLTIKGEDKITLDRAAEGTEAVSALLAAYNGQTVDVDVVNRSFVADRWYTLVLPFNTKASEISNAFGYAVVDVPNESNTEDNVVSFKVHVGVIPANTLIVFKVEEDVEATAEKPITFSGKEIIYEGADVYTTDGALNEYHGVYETTEPLNLATQWYLNSGTFWNAGTNPGVKIAPMGGYIVTQAGLNARIFVEDADGSTTEINAINVDKANNAEGWYTVGGVKLNAEPTEKGVYINNGKKVVIK